MNGKTAFLSKRKNQFMVGLIAALFVFAVVYGIYLANQPKQVVFIHNGETRVVQTKAEHVGQFLEEQHVPVDSYDEIHPPAEEQIREGVQISYVDKWAVDLRIGNDRQQVVTNHTKVKDILLQNKISLSEWDRTEPSIDSVVPENGAITVTRVEKKVTEVEETIPFNHITRKDLLLAQGQKKTVQEGQAGKAMKKYEVVYENGKETSRTLLGTKVTQPKKDRIVAIGTLTTVSRGGTMFVPRRVLSNVTLTAYSAGAASTGKDPSHPQYGITASGNRAQEGRTIAVDPRVIPIGTWVYIEGVGFRRAEDTGGAVKGNKIDVYYESHNQAVNFGTRRTDKVYVIGNRIPK